jgi:2,3-diketo-5-methylthio-1-phosphopentane phosphatase
MTAPTEVRQAAPPLPLDPAAPPLAILVDYDGTIARTDVSDALMADFVTDEWIARAAEYDAGLVGSRRLMEWEVGLIATDPDELRRFAAEQPHDPVFATLARRARAAGIPVEVVSDGFGFFIPAALAALGVPDVPVISASTTFDRQGRARIDFPNGNPACFVCGTCKRNRVLAHQAAGRAVVFIGDGESDRYAAGYSDVVFAKRALAKLCQENGWPFREWREFGEIDAWLAATIDRWRADRTSLPGPRAAPYFCGAEVWGEGRWDPPAPAGRPDATSGSEGTVPG